MSFLQPGAPSSLKGAWRTRNIEQFPNPFDDIASLQFPDSLADAFRWCEFLLLTNGIYRSAIDRAVSYFITDVEIEGTGRAEKAHYKDFLHNTLGIKHILRNIAMDFICYGNSINSIVVPFRRYLSCKQCGNEAPLKVMHNNSAFGFTWDTGSYEFRATCPKCNYSGPFRHVDRRSTEEDKITIKRWNPHEVELVWDPYSDETAYVWRLPMYYKNHIQRGRLHHLERAPWEVIQAVKRHNSILFDNDVIYHAKEETFAGVLNKGWGISRVLTNFRQAWYVQVLHRFNEAIALDYVIPFRLLTPEPRSGGGGGEMSDPLFTMDMGGFSAQIQNMLRQRRRDPASWHTLPFPVKYQAIGGEASQLAPFELMDQGVDTLLNSINIPVDFYKGNLTIQAAPAALRLLESSWSPLVYTLNQFLRWLTHKIAVIFSWDEVECRLARPSHVDDLNRQLAKLQLMMGQQISQTTGLQSVGIDFTEEQKRLLEEQKFVAEESQRAQEELELAGLGDQMAQGQPALGGMPPGGDPMAVGGAPPAGGAPPPGGDPMAAAGQGATPQPGMPVDPVEAIIAQLPQSGIETIALTDLHDIADTTARQVFSLPAPQRQSALRKIKQKNEVVHSLVKSKLDSMDSQAKTQGLALAQQSAQQAQQGSMAMPPPM
jgi:hypothetical protein